MNRKSINQLIIHESEDFVMFNKPASMSVVYDKTKSKSLQQIAEEIFKVTMHPITRIDKVVSGVCLFAKNKEAAKVLSDKLSRKEIGKKYIAIVEGKVELEEQRLVNYIKKKGNKAVIKNEEDTNTKRAVLTFERVVILENYTVLLVTIETGRYHQIRAQLAAMGHPVKGDIKYGARRKNKDRSIHLHSWKLNLDGVDRVAPLSSKDILWRTASEKLE